MTRLPVLRVLLCGALSLGSPAVASGWGIDFAVSGSLPVISGGVLYVGSADGAVYAVDVETGALKWRFQTGESLSNAGPVKMSPPPGSTDAERVRARLEAGQRILAAGVRRVDMIPLVADGTVFVGSGDRSLYALDSVTGKPRWSYEAGPGMALAEGSGFPKPPPVLADGTLYLATQTGLHALDAQTGQRKWLFETTPLEPLTPALGEGAVIAAVTQFRPASESPPQSFLEALDPESGKPRWTLRVDGKNASAPLRAQDRVFFSVFSERRDVVYAVSAADGRMLWKFASDESSAWAPFLAGGAIHVIAGNSVSALDAATGQVRWSFRGDEVIGRLAADEQRLYVVTSKPGFLGTTYTLHALALDGGRETWSRTLSSSSFWTVVADGVVYAGKLDAIDAATGQKLWTYSGPMMSSAPVVWRDKVFVFTHSESGSSLRSLDARSGRE